MFSQTGIPQNFDTPFAYFFIMSAESALKKVNNKRELTDLEGLVGIWELGPSLSTFLIHPKLDVVCDHHEDKS